MDIIIATDGGLEPEKAVEFATRLVGDGTITILTVVEVPRTLLADLRSAYGERPQPQIDSDVEYVGNAPPAPKVSASWPGDDTMIHNYVEGRGRDRTAALADALRAAGYTPDVVAIEGEEPVRLILAECARRQAGALIVGTHGQGRFEGLLGSTSTKLSRRAPCPVVIIR